MKAEDRIRQIVGAGFSFDSIVIDGERFDMVDGHPVFVGYGDQVRQVVLENIYDFLKNSGGISGYTVDKLVAAGYETVDDLRGATDDDLLSIDGIGPKYLGIIRRALNAS